MLLIQAFPGRGIARALVVLPWAVPVSLAALAWLWMFNSLYSVINWTLIAVGLMDPVNPAAMARHRPTSRWQRSSPSMPGGCSRSAS